MSSEQMDGASVEYTGDTKEIESSFEAIEAVGIAQKAAQELKATGGDKLVGEYVTDSQEQSDDIAKHGNEVGIAAVEEEGDDPETAEALVRSDPNILADAVAEMREGGGLNDEQANELGRELAAAEERMAETEAPVEAETSAEEEPKVPEFNYLEPSTAHAIEDEKERLGIETSETPKPLPPAEELRAAASLEEKRLKGELDDLRAAGASPKLVNKKRLEMEGAFRLKQALEGKKDAIDETHLRTVIDSKRVQMSGKHSFLRNKEGNYGGHGDNEMGHNTYNAQYTEAQILLLKLRENPPSREDLDGEISRLSDKEVPSSTPNQESAGDGLESNKASIGWNQEIRPATVMSEASPMDLPTQDWGRQEVVQGQDGSELVDFQHGGEQLEFTQEHYESMVDFQMTPIRELVAEMSEVDKKDISKEDMDRLSAAFDSMERTFGNVSYEKALEYSDLTGELVKQVMECDIRPESLDMHARAILFSEKMSGQQSYEWGESPVEGSLSEVLAEYSDKEYFHVASLEAAHYDAPNVIPKEGESPQDAISRAKEALAHDEQAYMAEGRKYQDKIYAIAKSAMGYKSGDSVPSDGLLQKFIHGDYSRQASELIDNPAAGYTGAVVNGRAPHFQRNSKIGMQTFLSNIEAVGVENMEKLADSFGVNNFGTYSSTALEKQLDVLNNPEAHKDISIIISGSTGDHSRAKESLLVSKGSANTLYLEAETAADVRRLTGKLSELQSQGAVYKRLSIVGHGSPTGGGIQFSDSFRIDRGVDNSGKDSFEKSGMAGLTGLVEPGVDGLKPVTLVSCHQGETFAPGVAIVNNPTTKAPEAVRLMGGNLPSVLSKRYPDLAITAGQGPVYLLPGERVGVETEGGEKVLYGVQSPLARRLDRFRKIPSIDRLAQKLNMRAYRKHEKLSAEKGQPAAYRRGKPSVWRPRTFAGGRVHSVSEDGKVKVGS